MWPILANSAASAILSNHLPKNARVPKYIAHKISINSVYISIIYTYVCIIINDLYNPMTFIKV